VIIVSFRGFINGAGPAALLIRVSIITSLESRSERLRLETPFGPNPDFRAGNGGS